MRIRYWSSDVCSSDLCSALATRRGSRRCHQGGRRRAVGHAQPVAAPARESGDAPSPERSGGTRRGDLPRGEERQNWTRGGSEMAAPSTTSKNSRSLKPRLRAKRLFGNTLILVFSSRTPPL